MPRSYERVEINGRSYLVCAICRRPLSTGHNPLYNVIAPGVPLVTDPRKEAQVLCGPDYKKQWREVYPNDALQGEVADGFLDLTEVAPSLRDDLVSKGINVASIDNLDVWEQAIIVARSSGGSETVAHAYKRLSEQWEIDVEISAPVHSPEDQAAALEHEEQIEQAADLDAKVLIGHTHASSADKEEERIRYMAQAMGICNYCLDALRDTENFQGELKHAYDRGLYTACEHMEPR